MQVSMQMSVIDVDRHRWKLTAYANHIDAGRFIKRAGVAENEHAYTEIRFTYKGITWLAGEIASSKTKALMESN